ncbi:efflux RND transporter permease subunit [Chelativorans sp. M5D2P16]|uniref:efflux RND transporter permease subunit n=1 Tax=Chelativorans sp. M5D2P16 TaxID=3095678 RepID=UPI002ACAAEC0|nr:efflux RND transporter permease subunit [Chelativorans sp. M5D2P16]MDZ5699456.1 efflux RND transporter permease subunit [Chelativorans sp. M5D2P16]
MANFFIDRPIFAIVLAIATMLAGVISIYSLPISQYPDVAPVTVRINATYPGATAEAVQNSVTSKIEGELTGLEGLLYVESTSSTGSGTITLTFDTGIDPELAQVEVQNRVARVESQLPESVQRNGIRVMRSASGFLMIGNIYSRDGRYSTSELNDIMTTQIEERIQRIEGVGSIQSFGSGYAMRIWLDPMALAQYQLTPSDVVSAISAQNVQVSAGSIGSTPSIQGQQLRANIVAQSQLRTVEEFEQIILKSAPDGSLVQLSDVARIVLGQQSYDMRSEYNGSPSAGFGVQLASGANAIATAEAVKAEFESLAAGLPEGVEIAYSYETTPFVERSIEKVVHTLVEAILLVFVVLLLFLQNFRATFIPMVAVPVVLLGTFGVLAVFGYSINMLTMFAMVLAIGLLVDDAIVVVENVERIMTEEGLSAREATRKSMGEITGALIGIAMVLTAVFIPMALFAGSTGVIYRQFSITIATAMLLSVLVAIILTPALCASMLKPSHEGRAARWFGWFNRGFNATTWGYVWSVGHLAIRPIRVLVIFAAVLAGIYLIYRDLPSSFLPQEDQGVLMAVITLPEGASTARTQAVVDEVESYLLEEEKESVESAFMILGYGSGSSGPNTAMGFIRLKDFDERTAPEQSAQAVSMRAMQKFAAIRDAQAYVVSPPAIQGLGESGGFTMYLEDLGNNGRDALQEAANQLADLAAQNPTVTSVRGNSRGVEAQLEIEVDQHKAGALGVDLSAANALISTVFAGSYVNDFVHEGEIKRVYVQADAPFRMQPDDINRWYAKNDQGEMVPFSAFTNISWTEGLPSLSRFNGTPALMIQGSAAEGVSSGEAMVAMEDMVAQLEGGYGASWSGISYQERVAGNQEMMLYGISVLVVFLCLAALYESWSIPFSVLLAVPVGVLGALLAAWLFGQPNDVYFKVGLLTTVGLSAKNAILIVEFARDLYERGVGLIQAVTEAARMRLRPIVMTSLAFALGVTPLAIASGAGSAAQNAIGIGVLGGMISATILGVFFVPVFFVIVVRLFRRGSVADEEPTRAEPKEVPTA